MSLLLKALLLIQEEGGNLDVQHRVFPVVLLGHQTNFPIQPS